MFEKESFYRQIDLDISIATLGVYREDWYCCRPGMTRPEVKEQMIRLGYDVVPIIDKHDRLNQYFSLKGEGDKLQTQEITEDDKIYYLTHVRDVIWKMNKDKRTHYFLTNGRDENDIVGLVSLSDFNSRTFYVFLFNLFSFIEREFALLITLDQESAFQALEKKCNNDSGLTKQLEGVRDRIAEDKKQNIENDYKEYLYLNHLLWLVEAEKLHESLDYKKKEEFIKNTGKFRDIRNTIAHPTKSLIRTIDDLKDLEAGLNKIYEFKERLDKYKMEKKRHELSLI